MAAPRTCQATVGGTATAGCGNTLENTSHIYSIYKPMAAPRTRQATVGGTTTAG